MKSGKFKQFLEKVSKRKLDILVAFFLGVTTLLVAWAGWIGSLHGGIQAINFTRSNNLAAEGNSEYNVAAQIYISDMFTWNTLRDLSFNKDIAEDRGDSEEAAIIETKINKIRKDSCSPRLQEALKETGSLEKSPFENEDFANGYFEKAKAKLDESQAILEEGKLDNLHGDAYRLVSVIFSLVLFLLGIVGIFKDFQSRKALFVFSVIILTLAIIYMITIPMPTGFSISNFFNL